MTAEPTRPRRDRRRAYVCVLGAVLISAACNDRFLFDTMDTAGSGGASSPAGQAGTAAPLAGNGGAPLGGSTSTGGGSPDLAGAQAAGAPDLPSGGSGCGTRAACPAPLRCEDGECYECTSDLDCATPGLTRCNLARHRCVPCLVAGDCETGFTCDALANRCLQICEEEEDCPTGAHGCDERRRVCYQCDEDRECAASSNGPLCAPDGSGCVQCRAESDCPARHCDQLAGRCVDCRDGRDCASGLCDPGAGQCLTE